MFQLQLLFPKEYPQKPPQVRFLSKMFHPNGQLSTNSALTSLPSCLVVPLLCCASSVHVLSSLLTYSTFCAVICCGLVVFADGQLCLDIIQDKWSPIYTVSSLLSSIQSLLTDPNTASPANQEAARLLANDLKEYRKRVRQCAAKATM